MQWCRLGMVLYNDSMKAFTCEKTFHTIFFSPPAARTCPYIGSGWKWQLCNFKLAEGICEVSGSSQGLWWWWGGGGFTTLQSTGMGYVMALSVLKLLISNFCNWELPVLELKQTIYLSVTTKQDIYRLGARVQLCSFHTGHENVALHKNSVWLYIHCNWKAAFISMSW